MRNPKWADESHSSIDCLIKTNTLLDEIPFTASLNDPEPHGREIFAKCIAGDFGEIATMEKPDCLGADANQTETPVQLKRLEMFLGHANLENSRRSFRSVVILWGSFLDDLLDELLEAAYAAGKIVGKPPRTFNDRIKMAYSFRAINQEEADKCHHIRNIRNAAAHEWELSLDTNKVLPSLRALYEVDHSEVLVFHEDLDYLLQQVYSASCAMLITQFLNRLATEPA